jgi:hypothetical protein
MLSPMWLPSCLCDLNVVFKPYGGHQVVFICLFQEEEPHSNIIHFLYVG